MSDDSRSAGHGDEARVEELLRINAELAAEIRSLQAGRISEPRSAAMPAARRLGRLTEERDELQGDRDRLEAQNQEFAQHIDNLTREYDELAARLEAQSREVTRLRSGIGGILRRARARLLRA